MPTPFVVNTLVALPNLPGVALPTLPEVTVPTLPGGVLPTPGVPGGTTHLVPGQKTTTTTTTTTINGIPGDVYVYNTGAGAPQLAPGASAASGFDPSRYFVGSPGSGSGSGSGGRPGSYDGASVPVFGQHALDGSRLNTDGSQKAASASAVQTLPAAALAALVALVAVTAALVRTHQAARARR